jgi:hypothetical protein
VNRNEILALLVRAADVGYDQGRTGQPHDGLAREVEARLGHELPLDDEANFRRALTLIHERIPDATVVTFETSDQDTYGFILFSHNGTGAIDGELDDELWPLLCNLRWNGVVGENKHGHAMWNLVTRENLMTGEGVSSS